MSALKLIRSDLAQLQTYTPSSEFIENRLHSNELPICPLDFDDLPLNFYPSAQPEAELKKQLAALYQVDANQLTLTIGSDNGIDTLMRLFIEPGKDAILQCPPTFPMYRFYAQLQQAAIINCPLNPDDFSLDNEQLAAVWQENCKLIFICSPNNPTGNLIPLAQIEALCQAYQGKSIIVVDEAYIEFARTKSATALLARYDNLVVLRTLSKFYGLAGLRLGVILTQAPLIAAINRVIPPYSLSSPVTHLGLQALQRMDWLQEANQAIHTEKEKLILALQTNPLIEKLYPSAANFIFLKTTLAKELSAHLKQANLVVRDFPNHPDLHHYLRITIGRPDQNHLLLTQMQMALS